MANIKISALPVGAALAGTEVAPFVQPVAAVDTTVKITAQQIANYALTGAYDSAFVWDTSTNTLSIDTTIVSPSLVSMTASVAGAMYYYVRNTNGGSASFAGILMRNDVNDGLSILSSSSGGNVANIFNNVSGFGSSIYNGGSNQMPVYIGVSGNCGLGLFYEDVVCYLGEANRAGSYQAPATGFTITMANHTKFLTLEPAGTLATGTINLPAAPIDGQEIEIATTQTVTALTVSGNGNTINNAPTTLVAGAGFAYRYRTSNTTWYRRY